MPLHSGFKAYICMAGVRFANSVGIVEATDFPHVLFCRTVQENEKCCAIAAEFLQNFRATSNWNRKDQEEMPVIELKMSCFWHKTN